MTEEKICETCGETFLARRLQRFCEYRCYSTWLRLENKKPEAKARQKEYHKKQYQKIKEQRQKEVKNGIK